MLGRPAAAPVSFVTTILRLNVAAPPGIVALRPAQALLLNCNGLQVAGLIRAAAA